MKEFELLRYLKRFRWLIFLFALLGALVIAVYANHQQQYVAQVTIQYTNAGAKDGKAPDGTALDVQEITSAAVVARAAEMLGEKGNQGIRSHVSITPVISDTQQTINEVLASKGEETAYIPDTYQICLQVDGEYGADAARNALDALLQSYCTYYTEKYVEQYMPGYPSEQLLEGGYDYYPALCMLSQDVQEMLDYLKSKKEQYPQFRSSQTGWGYADLYEQYQLIYQTTLPQLYAQVLSGPQARDAQGVLAVLDNALAELERTQENRRQKREKLQALREAYAQPNAGMMAEDTTGQTLGEVSLEGAGWHTMTTYDALTMELVRLDEELAEGEITRTEWSRLRELFATTQERSVEKQTAVAEGIVQLEATLKAQYEIVRQCAEELTLYVSAQNLRMVSSVRVSPTVNVRLYIVLALVLFFALGCCGAVLLGRGADMAAYWRYVDKKTNLPNRDRLNLYIAERAQGLLPENFTCFTLCLDNLTELTRQFGYAVGDGVLRDFSDLVRLMGDEEDMIGYNGVGQYLAFFDECSVHKAVAMGKVLENQVAQYNCLNPENPMHFRMAHVTSSAENEYSLRDLMRLAQARMQEGANTPC